MHKIKVLFYQALIYYWQTREILSIKLYHLSLRNLSKAVSKVDYYASKKFNAIDKYLK